MSAPAMSESANIPTAICAAHGPHRRPRGRPERAAEHLVPRQVRDRLAPRLEEEAADGERDGADRGQRERVHDERAEQDVDLVELQDEGEQ